MKRNRRAGQDWEREIVRDLKELGYKDAVTSRYASKMMDDKGVDILGVGGYAIQCKNLSQNINIPQVMNRIDTNDTRVILFKKTKKKGNKFYTEGKYAIIEWEKLKDILRSGTSGNF